MKPSFVVSYSMTLYPYDCKVEIDGRTQTLVGSKLHPVIKYSVPFPFAHLDTDTDPE